MPLVSALQHAAQVFQAVGDDAVDAQVEQALDLGRLVDRPDVDEDVGPVGTGDAPAGHQLDVAMRRGHLEYIEAPADRRAIGRSRAVWPPCTPYRPGRVATG